MKSLANSLLDIALGVCKDIRVAYPRLEGLDLDCERLALNCRERGLGFFSLDLPALDSLLTQGLETGRLVLSGPYSRRVSKRIRVPRFFSGLWLRVFDKDACLKEDADVDAILFLRQVFCLGKKVQHECSRNRLEEAVKEYYDIEHEMRPPTLQWEADELDPKGRLNDIHICDIIGAPSVDLYSQQCEYSSALQGSFERVQQVADLLSAGLGFCEPVTYSGDLHDQNRPSGFRHGPGAVADRRGIVDKYTMPRWSAKLEGWFPYRQCGTSAGDTESQPVNHEVASRLIAVAKTAKAPRLIAKEPTEHQWCQQVLRHFMVSRLKDLFGSDFVCFERQDLSQQMALQASCDRSLATIDLSSASDRLSCWLVERVFRRNPSLLHCLHAARTRYIRDDISPEPSWLKLRKFASQGTATTFPVQTFVFLCIAIGISIEGRVTWHKIRRLRSQIRVFGDDIIIPNARYAGMVSMLNALGLKVNEGKSFHLGHFRESCGMDGFKGFDVTPLKPQQIIPDSPATRQAVLDNTNNLFYKGFWHASTVCESTLGYRHLRRLPVVGRDSGSQGLGSFCGESFDHLTRRWHESLHRYEYRVIRLSVRTPRHQFGERSALLQYFTEAPGPFSGWNMPEEWTLQRELLGNTHGSRCRHKFHGNFISRKRDVDIREYESGVAGRPQLREKLRWSPLY